MIEGVDYSFARPQPRALANAGKKFAVRYGGPGSDSKHLHAGELAALRAVGIDVVANAEGTAGGYTGTAAGLSWAQDAEAHFRALGMPDDRPIYFSVDFDAGPAHWDGIDAAIRGSAQVIGRDRVGIYGSWDVMEHCRAEGLAPWLWQTYAWSGGRQASYVQLYQYRNGVTIGGGDCDLTRALTVDYGQWGYRSPEVDMAWTAEEKKLVTDGFAQLSSAVKALTAQTQFPTGGGQHSPVGDAILNGSYPIAAGAQRTYVWQNLQKLHAGMAAVLAAVGKDDADESAIVAGVLAGLSPAALASAIQAAGLTPEAIAAAIPQGIAQQTVDILSARMQA